MHIPLRMCVVCREHKPTEEFIRITHNVKTDKPEPDINGKNTGRGAYICRDIECLKAARKARRLEKSFACRIDDEVYDSMEVELENEQ